MKGTILVPKSRDERPQREGNMNRKKGKGGGDRRWTVAVRGEEYPAAVKGCKRGEWSPGYWNLVLFKHKLINLIKLAESNFV